MSVEAWRERERERERIQAYFKPINWNLQTWSLFLFLIFLSSVFYSSICLAYLCLISSHDTRPPFCLWVWTIERVSFEKPKFWTDYCLCYVFFPAKSSMTLFFFLLSIFNYAPFFFFVFMIFPYPSHFSFSQFPFVHTYIILHQDIPHFPTSLTKTNLW
jgi:hypothetical protein